jgi:predicted phosphodiesterase
MRIFAVSDLHTDHLGNSRRVRHISTVDFVDDVLVVAGDIAHDLEIIGWTLAELRARFARVFYVPGNHELWVRDGERDSIEKFGVILRLCDDIGVETHPGKVGDHWIVPLFSWYDSEYDVEREADVSSLEGWVDFYFCKWPLRIGSVADYFLGLNRSRIRSYDGDVITFSHFLPRRELLPTIEKLSFKGLPLVAGTPALDRQVREVSGATHVFGHSHIRFDRVIDGVRYVHHPFDDRRPSAGLEDVFKQIAGVDAPVPSEQVA